MGKLQPFLLRRATLVLLAAVLIPAALLRAAERRHLTLLSTTDLHGHVLPEDYFTGKPAELGLAKIATLIRDQRREDPHALLIDCGDTIQGSPLEYVHARVAPGPVDPMMLVMNALRYDCMTVGNHEYNFGLQVLHKAESEARFPWLSANTLAVASRQPAYRPFILRTIDGVRVAVIGITTPKIPVWEDAPHYAGLEFADPVATARRWVDEVRKKDHADVVVLAVHMGLEEDLGRSDAPPPALPGENQCLALARQVPGVDVILMGHTHRVVPDLFVNGVLLAQAGHWGDCLARVDLYLQQSPAGTWTVIAKSARTIPVTREIPADPVIEKIVAPYEAATQAWLRRPIGRCAVELDASRAREQDTALIDFINQVQAEAGHADVSFASSFNPRARIPAGPVTVREVYSLYVYENTLVVVQATGAQIKAALEHSALYYRAAPPGTPPAARVDPTIPGYNFDIASGLTYTMDLTRPPGQRIVGLSYRGRPLAPDARLRVALNNYRFGGGGGYTMFKDCPVVWKSSEEIRNLIIDWLERHHEIPTAADGHWRITWGAPTK